MRNNYEYIDPDYTYSDPKTSVMRNLANITNPDDLLFFESTAVVKRLKELEAKPVIIHNAASLLAVHKHLFQDVYEWAGQKRTVEISKQGKQFFLTNFFDSGFAYIDNLIAEYKKTDPADKHKLAHQLADLLDSINYLHPFREGNGRTQREFLRTLAFEKGHTLNLNPPNNADIYERYMSGTIDGDVDKLAGLIEELLEKG